MKKWTLEGLNRIYIPKEMLKIRAKKRCYSKRVEYCNYNIDDEFYILGYNTKVYFVSTSRWLPFNITEESGFVDVKDFIILEEER
jgi:hypothetical protein